MEALVLLGLVGAGYLYNSNKEDQVPVTSSVKKQVVVPNGENVYHSEKYQEVDHLVRSLAKEKFDKSQKKDTKVINTQRIDIPQDPIKKPVENYENYTYSSASGSFIPKNSFMSNDQGVKIEPFFSSAPPNVNLGDTRALNALQGGNEFYRGKKEIAPLFSPEQGRTNVFGMKFGKGIGDKSRYEAGMLRTNELPFAQEKVQKIDVKSGLNNEVGRLIAAKTNIDETRTINNPRMVAEGRIIKGGSNIQNRGKMGSMFQHNPEKYYENTEDRWTVTTGAIIKDTSRPTHILPQTNRMVYNKQEMGIAAPQGKHVNEQRPNFRKSLNQQLASDTMRNLGTENSLVATDFHQQGYRALPNEREVTGLRNFHTNVGVENSNPTVGPLDEMKRTIRESTMNTKQNGNIQNTSIYQTLGLQDDVRMTKKQTTINSKNNGNIKGIFEKSSAGYEKPENTTKDSTLFSYMGGGGGYLHADMNKHNYDNAETNPTKEIIAQGREPTLNNVKIANGMDKVNVDIKKIEDDYMNHRINGADKVYQTIPTDDNCEITTMKEQLENEPISDRIDPELLDPFKSNPYTQSLSSYAY
tara:strand:- start:285 stop:2033 length:1749 start_codon:yes stop_codon:yes gene_type:complete